MKIIYHDEEGMSITVNANLQEARKIKRVISQNIFSSKSRSCYEFNMDMHEDKVRHTPDDDFECVQLGENLARSIRIKFRLSPEVYKVHANRVSSRKCRPLGNISTRNSRHRPLSRLSLVERGRWCLVCIPTGSRIHVGRPTGFQIHLRSIIYLMDRQ